MPLIDLCLREKSSVRLLPAPHPCSYGEGSPVPLGAAAQPWGHSLEGSVVSLLLRLASLGANLESWLTQSVWGEIYISISLRKMTIFFTLKVVVFKIVELILKKKKGFFFVCFGLNQLTLLKKM